MQLQKRQPGQDAGAGCAQEKRKTLRDRFFRCYWSLERLTVPGLRSSQYAYYETIRSHLNGQRSWLDLGCGRRMFPKWMRSEEEELVSQPQLMVGLDYDLPSLKDNAVIRHRAVADARYAPVRSGVFDVVTANMVVEHLSNPPGVLAEIRRMLKPGGLFVFHTPNYRNYMIFLASLVPNTIKRKIVRLLDERREADVFPALYRMNTPAAIRHLAQQTGFRLIELRLENTSAVTGTLGPFALFELLIIKLLSQERFQSYRPDIVAVLESPA